MSVDPMQQQGPPPMLPVDPAAGLSAMLRAIESVAGKAAGTDSAAEAKDFALAAQAFAGAITMLDPTRLAGGDTPEGRAASVPRRDGDHDGTIGE